MDNKFSKINWLNVIHNEEFQVFLDAESIKEISLLSKLIRQKLKPILFKYIILSAYNFNFVDNINFTNFFNNLFKSGLLTTISSQIASLKNSLCVEEEICGITCGLLDIKRFAKSFYLKDVGRGGFYLFPIVYNFNSLSDLKLKSCSIPFSHISYIGDKLPNLRNIKLEYVYFVKSLSDSIPTNEFILPSNLYHFEIYYCKVVFNEELPDPYEFIFSKEFTQAVRIEFKLPKCLVPSLKKLTFFYNNLGDCGLEKFLTLNPKLEALTLEYLNPSIISNFNSIKSLEFKYLIGLDLNTSYPAISSITHLTVNVANVNYYEAIRKLCLFFPNLEYLYFNVGYEYSFQKTINRFIAPILSNLFKLKTLELIINEISYIDPDLIRVGETQEDFIDDKDIDLAKFPNIDTLILDCDSETIYNLNFDNCNTLKLVKLISMEEINKVELTDKFANFRNWKFSISKNTIRGYNTVV